MNKINIPLDGMETAFNACTESIIGETGLKDKFEKILPEVLVEEAEYKALGEIGRLYSIEPVNSTLEDDLLVIKDVTKDELTNLYSYYMVKREPGRRVYDRIMTLANEKCPFCGGIGRPRNLDHYLPKTHFPQYSVLPLNLVPSCRDCNMDSKGAKYAEIEEEQVLHPYLDHDGYFNEQWVHGSVNIGDPCVVEFSAVPPEHWRETSKKRVLTHFKVFDLAKRYSVQAADEISIVVHQRRSFMREMSAEQFRCYLNSMSTSHLFVNHWKRVLYQALAEDDEFCHLEF